MKATVHYCCYSNSTLVNVNVLCQLLSWVLTKQHTSPKCMHTHMRVRTHGRTHARTHARTHTHTHTHTQSMPDVQVKSPNICTNVIFTLYFSVEQEMDPLQDTRPMFYWMDTVDAHTHQRITLKCFSLIGLHRLTLPLWFTTPSNPSEEEDEIWRSVWSTGSCCLHAAD